MSECCVKFKNPVSKEAINYLVVEYLKYILYCRGQLPMPLDQLKRIIQKTENLGAVKIGEHTVFCDENNQQCSAASLPKKINERTKQTFEDSVKRFDKFFNDLGRILQNEGILEVVLSLGANMMSPRELHRIALPSYCADACNNDPAAFKRCRLEFFRTLMHSTILHDIGSENITPISVLLKLKAGVSLNEYMEQKRFYAPPQKCKQVFVRFDNSNESEATNSLECSTVRATKHNLSTCSDSTDLWVKLKSELKGFKNLKEPTSEDSRTNIF